MERSNINKLSIVYFHRYPIEYEAIQYPGMRDLFDELLKKYRVIYFSMKGVKSLDNKLREGIEIIEIPLRVDNINSKDKWIKTFFYYLFLPITILRLRKLRPNFIICKETLPFIPLLLGKLRIPMIIDISDWWWSILLGKKELGRKLATKLEDIEVRHWSKLKVITITHSKAEEELVEQKGISKSKIEVINAPLYKEVYFPIKADKERKKLGFSKKDFVVALHGIIHPSKGYDQILEWWKRIVKIHNNWKLLIIGGASGEKWCRKEIKKLGLEKSAIMTGWLPTQSDVNRYLNVANCLLVSRRNTKENKGVIPSALYHSLMLGKPVIVTGLPGMSEIIRHGVNGYLFEPDSYESFKGVLETIYKNPKKSAKVGKQGIKRGEECFNPEIAAKKWREVIDKTIDIT